MYLSHMIQTVRAQVVGCLRFFQLTALTVNGCNDLEMFKTSLNFPRLRIQSNVQASISIKNLKVAAFMIG